jgi:hypothetical protein
VKAKSANGNLSTFFGVSAYRCNRCSETVRGAIRPDCKLHVKGFEIWLICYKTTVLVAKPALQKRFLAAQDLRQMKMSDMPKIAGALTPGEAWLKGRAALGRPP